MRFQVTFHIVLVMVATLLGPTAQGFAGQLKLSARSNETILIHGARKDCNGELPTMAWVKKMASAADITPAVGKLTVREHAGQTRYSGGCKKTVPVVPVYYTAPKSFKGVVKIYIFRDLITVDVK